MEIGQITQNAGIFESIDEEEFGKVVRGVLQRYPEESFYFLNEGRLRGRVPFIKKYFLPDAQFSEKRKLIYAVKANPRQRIMQILSESGIDGFDCASMKEVLIARQFKDSEDIYFNNPVKKREDIENAGRLGVDYFTVQTRYEVNKVIKAVYDDTADDTEIVIRMLTHNDKAKINLSEKFGITEHDAEALIRYVKRKPLRLRTGLSMHTGSQNGAEDSYRVAIEKITDIARRAGGLNSLNLGGGLPVNHGSDICAEIKMYLEAISKAVRDNIEGALTGEKPRIIIEPGRSIIADSVDLMIPVLSAEKRGNQKCIYINDGAFTSFSDAVIHGWRYPIVPMRPFSDRSFKKSVPTTIYGRTCDSGDSLRMQYMIPADIRNGDYLHVPCAGAYMDSQATVFNGFDPPKYISYNI